MTLLTGGASATQASLKTSVDWAKAAWLKKDAKKNRVKSECDFIEWVPVAVLIIGVDLLTGKHCFVHTRAGTAKIARYDFKDQYQ